MWPQKASGHLGARFSERRIRTNNVRDVVGKGHANCIARARRELALHSVLAMSI